MKIRLLKNMGIEGKHMLAGTVIDADAGFARYQISLGRAESVDAEAKPPKGVISTTEGLAPVPENEPEKPEKPKKPAK